MMYHDIDGYYLIFINHNDGKILQVCGGSCYEDCCYNKVYSKKPCLEGVSCFSLICF